MLLFRSFSSKSTGEAASAFSESWQSALEKNVKILILGQINLTILFVVLQVASYLEFRCYIQWKSGGLALKHPHP
jgi:hypothetical protein